MTPQQEMRLLNGLRAKIIRTLAAILENNPARLGEVIKQLRDLADEMEGKQ